MAPALQRMLDRTTGGAPPVPQRAFLALGLALLAAAAFRLLAPGRGAVAAWRALTKEELSLREDQFLTGLPIVRDDMRLVIGELDLNQSAEGESAKRRLGLDLGTTKVWLTVPARVHYAVDLSRPGAVEFKVDRLGRFVAVFPDPRVQAVEIFTRFKHSAVVVGWARLRSRSGRHVEEELERGLYEAIKREASSSAALAGVKARGRVVLARFVADYLRREAALGSSGGFREVVVRFHGDSPAEETAWMPVAGTLDGAR